MQNLLEGEESRLNLTSQSPNISTTQHVTFSDATGSHHRGTKRRRIEDQEELDFHKHEVSFCQVFSLSFQTKAHADGPISITDVDDNGRYIRLENTTDEEVGSFT